MEEADISFDVKRGRLSLRIIILRSHEIKLVPKQPRIMSVKERISVLERDNADLKASVISLREQLQAVLSLVSTQPVQKKEAYYQALLSARLNAGHMLITGVGTTDITTADAHIEIKNWRRFQEVPGQLAKYQQAIPRSRSCVYFFGTEPPKDRYEQIINLMEAANIEVFSFDTSDEVQEHRQHAAMSIVDEFARERLVRQEGITLKRPDGITAMRDWAQQNGKDIPNNNLELARLMSTRLGPVVSHHDSRFGRTKYGWKDLRLK